MTGGPLDFPPDEDAGTTGERTPPAERGRSAAGPGDAAPSRSHVPRALRGGRYGWIAAVVAAAVLVYITLNTLGGDHGSSTGLAAGSRLPPFAVPLAVGPLDGDANVARTADAGSAGSRPACSVRGPEIVNSCQLAERGPVVLAFFAIRGGDCASELDRLDAARRDFPGVQVAGVAIRGDRNAVRRLVRAHGWSFPVGYDRDGILANLYGVAVCPQVTYAYPGGTVRATQIGEASPAELHRRLAGLVRASRERGWNPT